MDCNSYSYAPEMLDGEPPIERYENDDMNAELRRWSGGVVVSAFSYDGSLDVDEYFPAEQREKAERLYAYIVESYRDTPPGDELEAYIDELRAA